ncbi:unnamed protein product [Umbelopsis ramanniana]
MNFMSFSLGGKKKVPKSKPTTSGPNNKPLFLCNPFVSNMLVKGSFKTIVELPKYVDANEWLAFNTFEFFTYINLFYGSIADFCTIQSCPSMSGGPGIEYTWTDAQSKKMKLPASQYVDFMATSIQNTLNDETLFPTKAGRDFPRELPIVVRKIYSQLFRVFAHIYYHHYEKVLSLHEEGHFNSLFAHFISFAKEFDLLDKKETAPLQELIDVMERNGVIAA